MRIYTDVFSTKKGGVVKNFIENGNPYWEEGEELFHLITDAPIESDSIKFLDKGKIIEGKVEKIKLENPFYTFKGFKIIAQSKSEGKKIKEYLKAKFPDAKFYEHDISHGLQYLLENGVKLYENCKLRDLTLMAFDIEVYNPLGEPDAKRDPILMISYATNKGKAGVLTTKKSDLEFVEAFPNERALISAFKNKLDEINPHILLGYNSSGFDIPYIVKRASILKVENPFGKVYITPSGLHKNAKVYGRDHVDLYNLSQLFSALGIINTDRLTLFEVYKYIFGEEKEDLDKGKIWEIWEENLEKLAKYNLSDAYATLKIGEFFLPLIYELAKMVNSSLNTVSSSTAGQLVERFLMFEAKNNNLLIPKKPTQMEIEARSQSQYEGAYVKMPSPGLYENIVVFDFRSLYPSIIITYNIDPYTLCKEKCEEAFISPKGFKFRKSPKGLIPKTLERIFKERVELKKLLKENPPKDEEKKKELEAKQQALKILANSFYGYLGYARSRWYCRECAESITAWGRELIKKTEKMVEERGFKVIYMDTDSLFILLEGKKKEDALKLLKEINSALPGIIELDLEGFYKRGIFVSKKSEEKGAKKKYALLGEDGNIKIRGFELVRRDWSIIARETQKEVLEILLKEGSVEKAIEKVREVIKKVKEGSVPLEKMVIYSRLNKDPENYEVISPELHAAEALSRHRGIKPRKGMVVGFVITKKGDSISEKALPLELAKDYDWKYYVENQILPAVLKILSSVGVTKDVILKGERQSTLNSFFK